MTKLFGKVALVVSKVRAAKGQDGYERTRFVINVINVMIMFFPTI